MEKEIKKDTTQEIQEKKLVSSLQNRLIVNILAFVLFIVFIFIWVWPAYTDYSTQKSLLLDEVNQFNTITKSGILYSDYTSLVSDPELAKMVGKMGEDFYIRNFTNEKISNYLDFIKGKTENINKIKNSDKIKQRDAKLSNVLPSYQEGVGVDGANTDLDLVNYMENLLRAFGLQATSPLGIADLTLVGEQTSPSGDESGLSVKENDSLSSQIFYIPLTLSLKGRKADIADFLYYLQNVGKIEKVQNDDIKFYADNIINKNIPTFKNIYETKIFDVSSIKFTQYIDTSSSSRFSGEKSTVGFLSFIKNSGENNDLYNVDLTVKFYVRGMPVYKIQNFVLKVINQYKKEKSLVDSKLTQAKNRKGELLNTQTLHTIATLKSVKQYLSDLDQTVKRLEAGMKQTVGIENLYLDATKLNYTLGNISELINKSSQTVDKNKK